MTRLARLFAPWILITLAGACATGASNDPDPGIVGEEGGASGQGGAGGTGQDASVGGGAGNGGSGGVAGASGSAGQTAGGASGDAGSAGQAGEAGTAGASGSSGASGSAGAAGTAGSAGSSGNAGAAGTAGSSGAGGSAGAGGEAGSAGTAGNAGSGGSAGTAGSSGAAGSAGTAGSSGAAGSAGTAGSSGAAGSAGSAGTAGAAGSGGAGGSAGTGGSGGTGGAPCVAPVSGPCDDLPQCGCQAGENCDVTTAAGETYCMPAGQTLPYNNCTAYGQCQSGYSCVGGVCKPFCEANADCAGSVYRQCTQVYAGSTPVPGFLVCTQQCNPMAPESTSGGFLACGPNVQCVADDTGTTDCVGPAGTGGDYAICTYTTDCMPGFECINMGTVARCLQWCRNHNDCPGALLCNALTPSVWVATVEYGVCN